MERNLAAIKISEKCGLPESGVANTLVLLEGGATVPFISRYRKEMTGSLDDEAVGKIFEAYQELKELQKRKEYILKVIGAQNQLSPSIQKKIVQCWSSATLEDLYLPFKKKTKTKASLAREKGLEGLARLIVRQQCTDLLQESKLYLSKQVSSVEEALQGARDIIAEWINENKSVRAIVRRVFDNTATISSKVVKNKMAEASKYKDYFSFSEPLKKIPSHRLLAILRGENESLLRLSIDVDQADLIYKLESYFIKSHGSCARQIQLAITDSLKRLLLPAIENEYRKLAKERADDEAISVFSENLKQLLLAPPLGAKVVLALDPGFRSGCKLVVLNQTGDLIHYGNIFPHPPQMRVEESRTLLESLLQKHSVDTIAIGNGTAGNETMSLLKSFDLDVALYLVNESGASIYSASEVARNEFPDHDVTVRGAVSIGRRLMDPLAELVKIDPKSIGVGQYQHDVNQSKLKSRLDMIVELCVNSVGVNLNTASKHLLSFVSGIGPVMAQNIVDHRSVIGAFSSRNELLSVPRLGKKAFEQAAGFLRITGGDSPLDNTGVHPERYALVEKMATDNHVAVSNLLVNNEKLDSIILSKYVDESVGLPTLKDIISALRKPGLDPRGKTISFSFADGINNIKDLKIGMKVPGIINNLTKFGAFVDIGIKESGLLHISQITNRFISDPAEVLKLNQTVLVKILDLDIDRKRISLGMKDQ